MDGVPGAPTITTITSTNTNTNTNTSTNHTGTASTANALEDSQKVRPSYILSPLHINPSSLIFLIFRGLPYPSLIFPHPTVAFLPSPLQTYPPSPHQIKPASNDGSINIILNVSYIASNTIVFCGIVNPTWPSGTLYLSFQEPMFFYGTTLITVQGGEKDPAAEYVPPAIARRPVMVVDNQAPYVVRVYSPNVTQVRCRSPNQPFILINQSTQSFVTTNHPLSLLSVPYFNFSFL